MFSPLKSIRTGERRETWTAFWTLFGIVAGHALLETARDALFLQSISATRLPFLYLAIAAISLIATRLLSLSRGWLSRRPSLSLETAGIAAITLAFWLLLPAMGDAGLYALYIWSGVMVTLVLIHFWTHFGNVFSITQAKRLYGIIGAGSVLGAIAGSALASALAAMVEARQLVLAAALVLGATAFVPMSLKSAAGVADDRTDEARKQDGLFASAGYVFRHLFTRRLLILAALSATALTLVDYLFKSIAAQEVAPADLSQFFAVCYLAFNVVSLLVQVSVVSWLIRKLTLGPVLLVFPAIVLLGGIGLALSASLVAAVLVKGADGSLRYSIDRTARELLFVPLSETARARIKSLTDVLGQRGGQALASVVILLFVWLGFGNLALEAVLIALALAWIAMAVLLRQPYLDIFRHRLSERQRERGTLTQYPHLDLASVETLIATLDSTDDNEVIAALDVLDAEDKSHLVPALILYHPSEAVVERALRLFTQARRKNVVAAADRLAKEGPPGVRPAAISAHAVIAPDAELLRQFLDDEDEAIRATATVHLLDMGELADGALDVFLDAEASRTRVGLAEAIEKCTADRFESALRRLADDPDYEVRNAAIQAMAETSSPRFLPAILAHLEHDQTRRVAQTMLIKYGDAGLDALGDALADTALPQALRWQLPRVIAQFDPSRAASMLTDHLLQERDGFIRFRIIRALEVIVERHTDVVLDRDILDQAIARNIRLAYELLDQRLTLQRGAQDGPSLRTEGHELLTKLLRDKQEHALGRLFRLLGLASPGESYTRIYRGLKSDRKDLQADSLELLDNVLPTIFREPVLGLVDERTGEERLSFAGAFHRAHHHDYDEVLQALLDSTSKTVQSMVVYHIGELRLGEFRQQIESLEPDESTRPDIARTLELLSDTAGSPASREEAHAR